MNKNILFVFILIATISIMGCYDIEGSKTLYLAHTLPQSHPVHKGILSFKAAVKQHSKGKLKIKVFPDGQLGSERELLELLQIGSVAITKVSAATMSNFVPEYKVLGLPYLFRDKKHYFDVLKGEIGKSLLSKGDKYWLRGLCFYDAGSRSFYTKNKPIRTPEDLKGLKIRVMNNNVAIKMVNALGGTATPMAYGELYTAIQQGVVDGAENNPPSFVSSNHFEVSKYYTLDEHSSVPDVLIIGTKAWNKLSKEEQNWINLASEESAIAQKGFWAESVAKSMKKIKSAGVEIIIPDKSLFSTKVENMLAEIKKDPMMKKLIEDIKGI